MYTLSCTTILSYINHLGGLLIAADHPYLILDFIGHGLIAQHKSCNTRKSVYNVVKLLLHTTFPWLIDCKMSKQLQLYFKKSCCQLDMFRAVLCSNDITICIHLFFYLDMSLLKYNGMVIIYLTKPKYTIHYYKQYLIKIMICLDTTLRIQ